MERGMVLVTGTVRGDDLLETAADYAAGADAELVLYAVSQVDSGADARQAVERVVARVLAGRDVEYGVVVEHASGSPGEQIVAAAEEHDCDQLFLLGRPQTGIRSIFTSDAISEALDGFDGFVTVGRETAPQSRPDDEGMRRPDDNASFVARDWKSV